jgi:hypothetical protein
MSTQIDSKRIAKLHTDLLMRDQYAPAIVIMSLPSSEHLEQALRATESDLSNCTQAQYDDKENNALYT